MGFEKLGGVAHQNWAFAAPAVEFACVGRVMVASVARGAVLNGAAMDAGLRGMQAACHHLSDAVVADIREAGDIVPGRMGGLWSSGAAGDHPVPVIVVCRPDQQRAVDVMCARRNRRLIATSWSSHYDEAMSWASEQAAARMAGRHRAARA